jgi:hypothetical protein
VIRVAAGDGEASKRSPIRFSALFAAVRPKRTSQCSATRWRAAPSLSVTRTVTAAADTPS